MNAPAEAAAMEAIFVEVDGEVGLLNFHMFFGPALEYDFQNGFLNNPNVNTVTYTFNSLDEQHGVAYDVDLQLVKNVSGAGFQCSLQGGWAEFVATRGLTNHHRVRLRWSEEWVLLLFVCPPFWLFNTGKRLTWQERRHRSEKSLPWKKRRHSRLLEELRPPCGWSRVTLENASRKRSIDDGIVCGNTWSAGRGYEACPVSFGVQDHCYHKFSNPLVCQLIKYRNIGASLWPNAACQVIVISEATVNAYDGFWEDKSTNTGKSKHTVNAAARGHVSDAALDYLLRFMSNLIVRDYMSQRVIDRVSRVLKYTAYDVDEVLLSPKKPSRGITPVLALSIASIGSDIHSSVYISYKQPLSSRRGLEISGLSLRVILDSKQLIKECTFSVTIDQLLRFICQKSSMNNSAAELKALTFHATFVDLMVADSKGLRKLHDYDSILGAIESGSEHWARGSAMTY